MDITQSFYDNMASQYDKLFLDWHATTREQADILNRIFCNNGFSTNAHVLDCACGIGTQANGDNYHLTQYIIEDGETLHISKYECEYRATRREELTKLLLDSGCSEVDWKFPEEKGFYQPVLVARK